MCNCFSDRNKNVQCFILMTRSKLDHSSLSWDRSAIMSPVTWSRKSDTVKANGVSNASWQELVGSCGKWGRTSRALQGVQGNLISELTFRPPFITDSSRWFDRAASLCIIGSLLRHRYVCYLVYFRPQCTVRHGRLKILYTIINKCNVSQFI